MRDIATLYGTPLMEASDEQVSSALSGAHRALDGMTIFDAEIERNWVDTITSLTAEMLRRGLPVN